MALVVTHANGTRSVDQYQVVSDPMEWNLDAETNRAGDVVTRGDDGRIPQPLSIEVSVQESTFSDSIDLIDEIISEAETATSVQTYRGTRTVDGIMGEEVTHDGLLVKVRLEFAPTGGDYT